MAVADSIVAVAAVVATVGKRVLHRFEKGANAPFFYFLSHLCMS
jgi:hypothetical protein